ncbi:hypothetical protein SKAU_G00148330 [Synaphobranchus kaupii]|uniref:Uncharacterized protein n=1 Tax=Synaphobranchus kaupii TaxID=118154 RepID=A0A9Q1J2S6_SYNKA|nr:hypothetical protein SKAU_G00148330 [Synaphobranchus kaupii]
MVALGDNPQGPVRKQSVIRPRARMALIMMYLSIHIQSNEAELHLTNLIHSAVVLSHARGYCHFHLSSRREEAGYLPGKAKLYKHGTPCGAAVFQGTFVFIRFRSEGALAASRSFLGESRVAFGRSTLHPSPARATHLSRLSIEQRSPATH